MQCGAAPRRTTPGDCASSRILSTFVARQSPSPADSRSTFDRRQRKPLASHRMSNSQKKAFPLRISSRLYDQLRVWADEELRSVNGQIEYILSEAVRRRLRPRSREQNPADGSGTESGSVGEADPSAGE